MSRRLLVIDDNDDLLCISQSILSMEGWQVDTAKSGPDGLIKAKEILPDAIILDYQMPDMSGEQFLAKMRSEDELADLPVVVFSSRVIRGDDEDNLYKLNIKGIIKRDYDNMARLISELLGWD